MAHLCKLLILTCSLLVVTSGIDAQTYANKYANPATPRSEFDQGLKYKSQETLTAAADDLLKQAEEAAEGMLQGGDKAAFEELRSRLGAASGALGKKGGDTKKYDLYLGNTAGTIDDTDWAGLGDRALAWLQSADGGLKWGKNIVFFLLILLVFRVVSRIGGGIVRRALSVSKLSITDLLRDFFVGTTQKVIFFIGLIVALPMIGVDVGPFLAGIGVAGFVIGFALQDTLSNFAAGVMILLYRPYDVGDVVSAGGITGKVHSMSLVSTTFRTPDNQDVVVPNGSIWGGVITNVTANSTRRVDMVFGIGYGDDMAKAEGVIHDILAKHDKVMSDPAPVVKVHELADSSVNFVVRPWSKTSEYWDVYFDVTRAVKERFDEEGISIPFPQQDVHMHQAS